MGRIGVSSSSSFVEDTLERSRIRSALDLGEIRRESMEGSHNLSAKNTKLGSVEPGLTSLESGRRRADGRGRVGEEGSSKIYGLRESFMTYMMNSALRKVSSLHYGRAHGRLSFPYFIEDIREPFA